MKEELKELRYFFRKTIDFNFHNTYYVFPEWYLYAAIGVLLIVLWLVYLGLQNPKH